MNDGPRSSGRDELYGFAERFRPGDTEGAERTLAAMERAGVRRLRTPISEAEYDAPGGEAWYDWLIPELARRFDLLARIHLVPSSDVGMAASGSRRQADGSNFVDHLLTRYGEHLDAVELGDGADGRSDQHGREDSEPSGEEFAAAIASARRRGIKTVLGGRGSFDAAWLRRMGEHGTLTDIDAVGVSGFSGEGHDWNGLVARVRSILDDFDCPAEIWITGAGYATRRHDEATRALRFLQALEAPADRLYWSGWQDRSDDMAAQDAPGFDARHGKIGVTDADGQPKLLARLLSEGGASAVRATMALATPQLPRRGEPVVVTGGAGFIGSNLADSFLAEGRDVVILDTLSRPGVERNLAWLKDRHGARLHWQPVDLRDEGGLRTVMRDAGAVFHLAAQVAVTTSLDQPMADFEVNARGTLNVLEAVRRSGRRTPVVFASTNKVYGNLLDLSMREQADRYIPTDNEVAAHGIGETRNLDFCTPYGCSKGVADQYVLDYAKSYDLPTAVLRMSCIYGPRQFGTEDQGWVAHFLIRALRGEGITIYGDGKQVRDILHVADAVAAYRALLTNIEMVKGRAFNLGGGPDNAVSLRVVLAEIARLIGQDLTIHHDETRQGDQTYFIADTRRLTDAVGWRATIGWQDGLRDLHAWLRSGEGPLGADAAARPLAHDRRLSA